VSKTNQYSKWVADGIKKPGKNAVGLAQHLTKALKLKRPMHRGTIHKIIAGTRNVAVQELDPISEYIEEPIPLKAPIGEVLTLPLERFVEAGVWSEVSSDSHPVDTISTPRDFLEPNAVHRAFCMRGDSMVKVGIFDRDALICIEPTSQKPEDGKFVIIERTRAGLVETSARLTKVYKDHVEYVCASDSEAYKPVIVRAGRKGAEGETVKTVAIIRRSTRSYG
jgi:SOS-response transcriptional repressor LexA